MATATTETLERVVRAYSVRDRLTDAQRQGLEAWLSRATVEVPGRVMPAVTAGALAWEQARDEELARLRAEVERLRSARAETQPAREEPAAAEATATEEQETPDTEEAPQEGRRRRIWGL